MKLYIILITILTNVSLYSQTKGVSTLTTNNKQLPIAIGTTKTYGVVVGISDYQDKDIPDLRFADKDAEAFANFLRSPAGGSLDGDHLKVLINQQATLGQLAAAFDWLLEQAHEGDNAIIYFSGHGDVEAKRLSQPGYLLGWDAPARNYMAGGAVNVRDLQDIVSTLSVTNKARVVLITDACRAGKLSGSEINGAQLTGQNLARQFANEIKILSCQPNEYSIEGEQWGGGRGAFSYNLVDALYGMADGNGDLFITLQEVSRYLEDKVTAEVAPVSQVPMVIGNRMERLASVDAKLLADLRSGRTSQMAMLSPVESRGIEDDVLAGVDTTTRELYRLFKKSLKDKIFLEPAAACTDAYYERLMAEPKMQRLHSTMTRNYAAALQDDAQQAMNIWLKADVQELECIGKSLIIAPIPGQLVRAAELLGKEHYMFRSLQARRLLFEGIIKKKHKNPDEVLGRECLSLFRQSLALEPQSALPWHRMSLVYANNLRMPDSAFVCAQMARSLAPNWVLPYADLGYVFSGQMKLEFAKQALVEAEAIDSMHPYVINRWAYWLSRFTDKTNLEKAVALFEKYLQRGELIYPCWVNDYATTLYRLRRYSESEMKFKEALLMDSTVSGIWNNLGNLYLDTRRFAEAEAVFKKSIMMDSTNSFYWNNLGLLYDKTRRYDEAEALYKKSILMDSTNVITLANLASLCNSAQRYAEAESILKKAILLDSTVARLWNNLGNVYIRTQRYAEAEPIFWRLIAVDSNHIACWNNLGNIYQNTNRYDEAEKMYRKAFALDGDFMGTYSNYAKLKIKTGDLQAAFFYLEQAIQKGYDNYQRMQTDDGLAPLREQKEKWNALMKKYFPDKVK